MKAIVMRRQRTLAQFIPTSTLLALFLLMDIYASATGAVDVGGLLTDLQKAEKELITAKAAVKAARNMGDAARVQLNAAYVKLNKADAVWKDAEDKMYYAKFEKGIHADDLKAKAKAAVEAANNLRDSLDGEIEAAVKNDKVAYDALTAAYGAEVVARNLQYAAEDEEARKAEEAKKEKNPADGEISVTEAQSTTTNTTAKPDTPPADKPNDGVTAETDEGTSVINKPNPTSTVYAKTKSVTAISSTIPAVLITSVVFVYLSHLGY